MTCKIDFAKYPWMAEEREEKKEVKLDRPLGHEEILVCPFFHILHLHPPVITLSLLLPTFQPNPAFNFRGTEIW